MVVSLVLPTDRRNAVCDDPIELVLYSAGAAGRCRRTARTESLRLRRCFHEAAGKSAETDVVTNASGHMLSGRRNLQVADDNGGQSVEVVSDPPVS